MKRFHDPNAALRRDDLPLSEKIWCAVIVIVVVIGAIWVSVHLGHR